MMNTTCTTSFYQITEKENIQDAEGEGGDGKLGLLLSRQKAWIAVGFKPQVWFAPDTTVRWNVPIQLQSISSEKGRINSKSNDIPPLKQSILMLSAKQLTMDASLLK